jgi:hypothetical protein
MHGARRQTDEQIIFVNIPRQSLVSVIRARPTYTTVHIISRRTSSLLGSEAQVRRLIPLYVFDVDPSFLVLLGNKHPFEYLLKTPSLSFICFT